MGRPRRVDGLAEAHAPTMSKCETFEQWAAKHLRCQDKDKFKRVFDAVKGAESGQEAS